MYNSKCNTHIGEKETNETEKNRPRKKNSDIQATDRKTIN